MPRIRFALMMLALMAAAMPARAVLTSVDIVGIEGELADNARTRLGIVTVLGEEGVPRSHLAWLHGRAPDQIREALEPFGYYGARVESELRTGEDGTRAVYRVTPGEAVKVRELAISVSGPGSGDEALDEVIGSFPLARGDVLDHRLYGRGKHDIRNALDARGYFDADATVQEVRVYPDALAADIELHWQSGRRYRFGDVQFDGSQFPASFMSRFVTFEPGDPYQHEKLLQLQRTLADSEYFASVEVNSLRQEAEGERVPVRVTVSPRKRDLYSAGVGYGTDTGVRVEGGFERRWVNRRGHRFRTSAELGERRSGVNAQYGIPGLRDNVRQYTIGASYLDEVSDSVDRRSTEFSVSREATWHGWEQIISINLLSERFELASEAMPEAVLDTRDAQVIYPMLQLSRSRGDDPVVPRRGWRLQGYVRAGHDALLSDTSFAQLGASAKLILPGPGRDRVLFRAQAATTWTDDFDELPASLRYYAGGDRSVRGFDYQAISPVSDAGELEGGKHLLVGSAEYEHMFREKWGVAAFVDAGDAFTTTEFDAEIGTGLGLRWRSPVGMVRLDVAAAVSEPGDPLEFHLVIGPDL